MERQDVTNDLIPDPLSSPLYIAGYLNTQIGKLVRVEFLVGDKVVDKFGVLLKVGISYIILRPIDISGTILCDLYSIKFVTIVDRPNLNMIGGFGSI